MNNLEQNSVRQRLLVPIKDERTKNRFRRWLSTNAQFWSADIRLFSILEPLWFQDFPYSAAQTFQLMDDQANTTAQIHREMAIYCQDLRNKFQGICISSDVCEGRINAESILDYARNWQADCILLLSTKKKQSFRNLLQPSLPAQVLRASDCMVLIVQIPDDQISEYRMTQGQPSAT